MTEGYANRLLRNHIQCIFSLFSCINGVRRRQIERWNGVDKGIYSFDSLFAVNANNLTCCFHL